MAGGPRSPRRCCTNCALRGTLVWRLGCIARAGRSRRRGSVGCRACHAWPAPTVAVQCVLSQRSPLPFFSPRDGRDHRSGARRGPRPRAPRPVSRASESRYFCRGGTGRGGPISRGIRAGLYVTLFSSYGTCKQRPARFALIKICGPTIATRSKQEDG